MSINPETTSVSVEQKLSLDRAVDPRQSFESNLENLKKIWTPEAKRLKERMHGLKKLSEQERVVWMEKIDRETKKGLVELQKNLLEPSVRRAIETNQPFETIYQENLAVLGERENLAYLIFGMLYRDVQRSSREPQVISAILEKYGPWMERFDLIGLRKEEVIYDLQSKMESKKLRLLFFPQSPALSQNFQDKIKHQPDGLWELTAKVWAREKALLAEQAKGLILEEKNGLDQIIKAKVLIKKECLGKNKNNPSQKLAEVVDPRLQNLLYAWANADLKQIEPEDLQHLAHLMSQKVRLGQIRNYEKKHDALRQFNNFLSDQAYTHAYQSIAEELYRALSVEQRLVVDARMGKLTAGDQKLINQYLTDVRTDKEKRETTQVLKELAPKNLLKIAGMAWGTSLAGLNAIASKGNVASNEYFWLGVGTAYTAQRSFVDKPVFADRPEKLFAQERRIKEVRPFEDKFLDKKVAKINGKAVVLPSVTLAEYIRENPQEMQALSLALRENKISQILKKSAQKIAVDTGEKKPQKISILTMEDLRSGERSEAKRDQTEKIIDGYKRVLFYESLKDEGINTLQDLKNYASVSAMNEKEKMTFLQNAEDPAAVETWANQDVTTDNTDVFRGFAGTKGASSRFENISVGNGKLEFASYQNDLNEANQRYGVPVEVMLKLLIKEGSHGNPLAKNSWSQAFWLWQMIPGTWNANKEIWADRTNPHDQIMAMANYLSSIQKRKNCDWVEAMAYYHTGEGILSINSNTLAEYKKQNSWISKLMQGDGNWAYFEAAKKYYSQ